MGNPRFVNINDVTDSYVWTSLNIQPDPPVSQERAEIIYPVESMDGTGHARDIWVMLDRKTFLLSWRVDRDTVLVLRKWFLLGAFQLYPDTDLPTVYTVEWSGDTFAPRLRPGGWYDVRARLTRVSG